MPLICDWRAASLETHGLLVYRVQSKKERRKPRETRCIAIISRLIRSGEAPSPKSEFLRIKIWSRNVLHSWRVRILNSSVFLCPFPERASFWRHILMTYALPAHSHSSPMPFHSRFSFRPQTLGLSKIQPWRRWITVDLKATQQVAGLPLYRTLHW